MARRRYTILRRGGANVLGTVVAALLGVNIAVAQQGGYQGHTPPHLWSEPRIFHTPLDAEAADLLTLRRTQAPWPPVAERLLSPNKAYWAAWSRPRNDQVRIQVFNERDGLLEIIWHEANPKYGPRLSWVNEKLLYADLWRGRLYGEYLILDVEAGTLLIRERMIYGQIHFQQWKQGCRQFPDSPDCAKPE